MGIRCQITSRLLLSEILGKQNRRNQEENGQMSDVPAIMPKSSAYGTLVTRWEKLRGLNSCINAPKVTCKRAHYVI